MSAWGKTGRVVLGAGSDPDVLVGGVVVGWVGERREGWIASATPHAPAFGWHIPSRDAAIMWVLRRAAPDVWREERGAVWRVASGCIRFGSCQCRYHWHIYRPDGSKYTDNGSTEGASGWHWAMCEVSASLAREATS